MKQPRVPEYREAEGVSRYLKSLILFLKDFTSEAWTANNQRKKEIENVFSSMPEIEYPVTSVNGKTGDVALTAQDVGALSKEETAADSGRFSGRTWAQAMLALHPVGSIYLSVSSTSPASLFGGTWERLQDRFLIGAGGSYGVGATGGAATHTLTVNEMPFHHHGLLRARWYAGDSNVIGVHGSIYGTTSSTTELISDDSSVLNTGGSQPHNNMPPYLSVYMWKRVS